MKIFTKKTTKQQQQQKLGESISHYLKAEKQYAASLKEKQKADPLTEHMSYSPHCQRGGVGNSRAPEILTCEQLQDLGADPS